MSNEFVAIMVLLIIMALWGILIVIAWISEKKSFNNGYCPRCNLKWKLFDHDSQGGRGYICEKCERVIWVSWPVDKEKDNGSN